ncbi:phosphatase PAP2 family protein [Chitinophaga agrisoli]|uniref:Phosphatase PAP2 family protein n=1 Tax=Chitinophaga agrisoli TaxID=2607653 RepID=A0A5B2VSQ8_9BACT|nr:phosphatase PAP2 family protein [Chitinophaga agrisoli]KAA2241322.1 phosphatase PAP2 family protein [Chitinophaga agrisoli]
MKGILQLLISFVLFPAAVNAQARIDSFDIRTLQHIADTRSPGQTKFFLFISNTNDYVNVAIPAGLLIGGIADHNPDMRQNALYIASSCAVTTLLNTAMKLIFKRPRPFKLHVNFTPVYTPGGYSFPSGHTSSAFSSATALARAYPKWYIIAPALLWSGTVGYSRLYLGVHNPSDVAAGAVLGAGTAFGLGFIRP